MEHGFGPHSHSAVTPSQPTDTDRLRDLNTLLDQALTLPEAEREAWLQALPPRHHNLTPTLRNLLLRAQAEVETDSFLRQPLPFQTAAEQADEAARLQAGDPIGPYRLQRELGRGGMAVVWLAERADGVRRPVALKLPHLGWSAGTVQRVARERDILSTLEHPHIARLYEAGITAEGRPWLAMEYGQGLPLDRHCVERRPTLAQRLSLFLQIADAVAFAHARLVVHRDLKPGNILVRAQGDVQLLDFGVAKLLQDDVDPDAQLTRQLGCAVTPDYAAPEQAAGQAVTMATDVYALGVVLFELLTDRRPYNVGQVAPPALAAAIERAPVPAPSSVVPERPSLARQLRGDLDTIVLKALRKAAAERYASVESMADDLRRHLQGEPVRARAPSWHYQAGRFLHRHRVGVLATGTVMVALSLGLLLAGWQWREAARQRQLALAQVAKAESTVDFVTSVLLDHTERSQPVTLETLLARSQRVAAEHPDPMARSMALFTLANWQTTLGQPREAERLLAETLSTLPAAAHANLRQMLMCLRANTLSLTGQAAQAQATLQAAMDLARDDPDARSYCLLMQSYLAQRGDARAGDIERAATEGLATLDAAGLVFTTRRALLLLELAHAQGLQGRGQQADAAYRAAVQQLEAAGKVDTVLGLTTLANWGAARFGAAAPLDALAHFQRARQVASRRSSGGAVPAVLISNTANALRTIGRYGEAEADYRLALQQARQAGTPAVQAHALIGLSGCALALARADEAQALLDDARKILGPAVYDKHSALGNGWTAVQAQTWLQAGRLAEAHALLTPHVTATSEPKALRNAWSVLAPKLRGEVATAQGHFGAARQDLDRALTAARAHRAQGGPVSHLEGLVWLALGQHHRRTGDESAAQAALQRARQELAAAVGEDSPHTRQALALLSGR